MASNTPPGAGNGPQGYPATGTAYPPQQGVPYPPPPQGWQPPPGYAQPYPAYHPGPVPPPFPGMQTSPAAVPPQPGQIIVGWEVIRPQPGCCQCVGLSFAGWMSVIILILLFWPLAWVPCVMDGCFEEVQRPVYGWPPQPPPGAYTAPYAQQPQRPPVVAEQMPSSGPPDYVGARMADEPPAKQV